MANWITLTEIKTGGSRQEITVNTDKIVSFMAADPSGCKIELKKGWILVAESYNQVRSLIGLNETTN
tara:strand:- start:588 stop:788 length:201 start_codon:yes stop_codon:yes gene_type:complete